MVPIFDPSHIKKSRCFPSKPAGASWAHHPSGSASAQGKLKEAHDLASWSQQLVPSSRC